MHREISSAKATAEIYVLAEGSRSSTRQAFGDRLSESREAAKVLGVSKIEFMEAAPDSAFNSTPAGQIVAALDTLIFSEPIDELFVPLPSFHADHRVAWETVMAALRPHPARVFPRNVYAYEYPGNLWGPAPPMFGKIYAPISEMNLAAKCSALRCHTSQWVSADGAFFGSAGVEALARLRGLEMSAAFAEVFYPVRGLL